MKKGSKPKGSFSALTLTTVLRLHKSGLKQNQLAKETGVPRSTLRGWIKAANNIGLDWQTASTMDTDGLRSLLFGSKRQNAGIAEPDWTDTIINTAASDYSIQAAYDDYLASNPNKRTLSRSAFYKELGKQKSLIPEGIHNVVVHQNYRPGQMLLIDYSGDGLKYTDRTTGEIKTLQVFVACLGFSGYLAVTLTPRQTQNDWFYAIDRTFEKIGGVPEEITFDNSSTLVNVASRTDPIYNRSLLEFCAFYEVDPYAVAPREPTYKALVERMVGIVQKDILRDPGLLAITNQSSESAIRNLQAKVDELVDAINKRPLADLKEMTREKRFEKEKLLLRELPFLRHSPGLKLHKLRVYKGNQIRLQGIRYNVCYGHVGKDVHAVVNTVDRTIAIYLPRTNEKIGGGPLRNPIDGDQPQMPEQLPESSRYLVQGKKELLAEIHHSYGDDMFLVAQNIGKPGNSSAVRHLRSIITTARKFGEAAKQIMADIGAQLKEKGSHVTYQDFKEAANTCLCEMKSRKSSAGSSPSQSEEPLPVLNGSDYYEKRGAQLVDANLKEKSK